MARVTPRHERKVDGSPTGRDFRPDAEAPDVDSAQLRDLGEHLLEVIALDIAEAMEIRGAGLRDQAAVRPAPR